MREWNLGANDPLCLTLAADARLSTPDYVNDQIWELSLEGTEPPALTLQTTFGLRAGWMRLFPRFLRGGSSLSDPAMFASPPKLNFFAPNYLSLSFSPFPGIDVQAEYWVPGSQTAAGRIRIHNSSILNETLRLEWNAVLNPLGLGESMSAVYTGSGYALRGKSEDLFPVFVLSGSPQPAHSPFAGLGVDLELFPGNERIFRWALTALNDPDTSLEQARQSLGAPWDGETARIHMLAEQQTIDIHSGNSDWDAAFAFAQKTAFGLFFPAGEHHPNPSFVSTRLPDGGFSPRGDGIDYPFAWAGQTGLETWYLSSLILPGAPGLARGLLENFIHIQQPDGSIDWKPGLAGQRGRHLAQPILCSLAWQIGHHLEDPDWLGRIYPNLRRFVQAWLSPEHDRDGDGVPEWDHPLQTGYEENPLVDRWTENAQGADISAVESPALPAFLFNELNSLIKIAHQTGHDEDRKEMEDQAARLRAAVEASWDPTTSTYRFRDRDSHHSSSGETICAVSGSGVFPLGYQLSEPGRLLVRIRTHDENTRAVRLILVGETTDGPQHESLNAQSFFWAHGVGRATTHSIYNSVDRIEIEGLDAADAVEIRGIDFTQEAIPLLLPLWARIPDEARAAEIIDKTILGRYLRPYGLPMCPPVPLASGSANMAFSYMIWNQLIGEGLLAYGRRNEAADLFTRLMGAVIPVLKQQRSFRQFYHAETGLPVGDRNALSGLPPLGLFLQIVGIDCITPQHMFLSGFNPLPGPITVQYRGMTVTREGQFSKITYPSGQIITLDGTRPYRLSFS